MIIPDYGIPAYPFRCLFFLHLVKILTRYDLPVLSEINSPSTIVPLSSFFAASASNLSTKVTNPKPFDPLSLKIISTS